MIRSVLFGCVIAEAFQTFNPMKVDFTSLTPKTWSQNLARYRSEESSQGVLFYSPGEKSKKYIEEVFNPSSKKLISIVRMMAIDCDAFEKHCKEEDPSESWKIGPTVVSYPPLPRPHKVLAPEAPVSIVVKELASVIPRNHVSNLKVTTFDNFVDDHTNATIPKVLYFSDKKSAPPSFHSIANSMNDRVKFAFINVEEEGSDKLKLRVLGKKVEVPAIAMLKGNKTDIFDGDVGSALGVFNWVNIHAETFVKGGGFSHSDAPEQSWMSEVIPEMTKESNGPICFKGKSLCAVYATPSDKLTPEETAMLESIVGEIASDNQKDAKLKFSWISTSLEKKAATALNVGEITEPHFLIINTNKRLRFTAPVPATKSSILAAVENLNAGNQRFTPIKDKKVPIFANRQIVHDEL